MKKLKLLPTVLMLVLCVGILAIGIYAVKPSENTITGSITVNATNAPVTIKIYKGTDTTGTPAVEKEVRGGAKIAVPESLSFNTEGTTEDPVNEIADVDPVQLTIVLSTTSTKELVVDTETIQTVDGPTTKNLVSLTKSHTPGKTKAQSTSGLPCFTSGYNYTITCTFRLGEFTSATETVTYTIPLDIYEATEYATEFPNQGINGIDYLYFGSFPQSEYTGAETLTEVTGETFGAYDDTGCASGYFNEQGYGVTTENGTTIDGETTRQVYKDSEDNKYVCITGSPNKYYKIEPIKWNILSTTGYGTLNTSGTLIVSDIILEQVQFHSSDSDRTINGNTVYANNYKYSSIRTYLNNTFYNNAFNSLYKQLIKLTTVDNSAASTGDTSNTYVCENTEDYIFSLSVADLVNTSYGYTSDGGFSGSRAKVASAYATKTGVDGYTLSAWEEEAYWAASGSLYAHLVEHLHFSSNEANKLISLLETHIASGSWLSRSSYGNGSTYSVSYDGSLYYPSVYSDGDGCVPALLLNL